MPTSKSGFRLDSAKNKTGIMIIPFTKLVSAIHGKEPEAKIDLREEQKKLLSLREY